MGVRTSTDCFGLLALATAGLLGIGTAQAQITSPVNSITGSSCSGGNNADGSCAESVAFSTPNNGTTFTSRYAFNVNADTGAGSTRDESGSAVHNLSFSATAPGSYRLTFNSSFVG